MRYDVFRQTGLGDQDVWLREEQLVEAPSAESAIRVVVERKHPATVREGSWFAVRTDDVEEFITLLEQHGVVVEAVAA